MLPQQPEMRNYGGTPVRPASADRAITSGKTT